MASFVVVDRYGREVDVDPDDPVVPPGCILRVSPLFMDAMQQRAAAAFAEVGSFGDSSVPTPRLHDGMGSTVWPGHRPGYAFLDRTPAEQGMYEDTLQRRKEMLREAWRTPPREHDDAVPTFRRGKRQMAFARNELRGRQGSMTPDQAYEAHKLALASAWRSP
jgi:hypothetical protein